ncbi:MAG: dTMP kinase [Patescibacteria group bacterium]|jgi:dTMP kinase
MALTIAIEGLPGCGKTTAIDLLVEHLKQNGLQIEVINIDTAGCATELKAIAERYPLGHPARVLLFWVLRIQQHEAMREVAKSADIVIADRFWGSTIAFDVFGSGVPMKAIEWFSHFINPKPDVVLYFDAPLEVTQKRKQAKTMHDADFASRIEKGYIHLAKTERWTKIDATKNPEEIMKQCLNIITAHIPRTK